MTVQPSEIEFEQRLRRSIAIGRLTISNAVGTPEPVYIRQTVLRMVTSAALGLAMAGFAILAVFVLLNLVFHFSMG